MRYDVAVLVTLPVSVVQVGEVGQDGFSVYLIPETLRVTVLGKRQVGDAVNIEIDAQTQVCL
jgi:riboflavin synthase